MAKTSAAAGRAADALLEVRGAAGVVAAWRGSLLVAAVVVFSFGLAWWAATAKRFEKWRKANVHGLELAIAFWATLAGVWLGMWASRAESERSERRAVVALAERARNAVDATLDDLRDTYGMCQLKGADSVSVAEILSTTPMHPAPALDVFLQSELALRYMSAEGYSQMLDCQQQAQGLMDQVNRKGGGNGSIAASIDVLGQVIAGQRNWLDVEIDFLKGRIGDEARHNLGTGGVVREFADDGHGGIWAKLKARPMRVFHGDIRTPDGVIRGRTTPITITGK